MYRDGSIEDDATKTSQYGPEMLDEVCIAVSPRV
jgi:hypothetical protein